MTAIDIFAESVSAQRSAHTANPSFVYDDGSLRVCVQEVTRAVDGYPPAVRVFEVEDVFVLDSDGAEVGVLPVESVALQGMTRVGAVGQWALIDDGTLISVPALAALAGVGRRYVNDEIAAGRLPALRPGRNYIVRGKDAVVWLQKDGRGSRRKARSSR